MLLSIQEIKVLDEEKRKTSAGTLAENALQGQESAKPEEYHHK